MSSLRPATIVATLFHLIGGSLAEEAEPTGPACSCERCQEAWWRNQSRERAPHRDRVAPGLNRVGMG
jgi:hypothetical protein